MLTGDMRTYHAVHAATVGLAVLTLLVAGSGLAGSGPAFWFLSRASGLMGYLLLWLSVLLGLLLSGRQLRQWVRPALALDCHRTLSGWALGFSLFHGLVLMGDRFAGVSQVWSAAGEFASVLLGALWLSSLFRRYLGNKAWRAVHYVAFAAYWIALAHALALGTDLGHPALALFFTLSAGSVVWLTTVRILNRVG